MSRPNRNLTGINGERKLTESIMSYCSLIPVKSSPQIEICLQSQQNKTSTCQAEGSLKFNRTSTTLCEENSFCSEENSRYSEGSSLYSEENGRWRGLENNLFQRS